MSLYEVDPEVFGLFVSWLYQRRLPTHTAKYEEVHLGHLAKLWIMGDRFLAPGSSEQRHVPNAHDYE